MSKNVADDNACLRHHAIPASFKKNVVRLAFGAGFAQIISFACSPILTRMYLPEAFGIGAIFSAITSIIGVIVCLGYESAIVLPESSIEAVSILQLCLICVFSTFIITVIATFFCGGMLLSFLGASNLEPYIFLIPIAVLIQGIFVSLNYWNVRRKDFGWLSIAQISTSLANNTGQIGAGRLGFTSGGTKIVAAISAQALATMILACKMFVQDGRFILCNISIKNALSSARRYKKFPLYNTWSAWLNTISNTLPTMLLGFYFSAQTVGFYALGHSLLNIPMGLLGNSVGNVFFQHAADARSNGNLPQVVENTADKLMLFCMFPFLAMIVVAPELTQSVFGEKWYEAGVYVRILTPWLLFVFIISPISSLVNILEIQEFGVFFNLILITTRVLSLVIGGMCGNVYLGLSLFSASGAIMCLYKIAYVTKKSGVSRRSLLQKFSKHFLFAGIFILPVLIFKIFGLLKSGSIIFATFLLFIGYASWMLKYNNLNGKWLFSQLPSNDRR